MRYAFLSLLALYFLFVFIGCSSQYSEGYRTGTVVHLKKKGWVHSTYEGKIYMGDTLQSTGSGLQVLPQFFLFSIDAEHHRGEDINALVDSLTKADKLGLPVVLHYNQELYTDWNFSRGETQYYVDQVKIIYR